MTEANSQFTQNTQQPANMNGVSSTNNTNRQPTTDQGPVTVDDIFMAADKMVAEKPKKKKRGCKSLIFIGLFILTSLVAALVIIGIFAPTVFLVIINILWMVMLFVVVIFLLLGVLVMFGLKDEVSRMINILFEGSLSLLDIADFFKKLYTLFIKYLKDLVLFLTPILSFLVGLVVYYFLMVLYKSYGKDNDITVFTMILAAVLVFVAGILNRPRKPKKEKITWFKTVKTKFSKGFRDSLEVIIFIFFLTMDSTSLFFLPDELNVELHAHIEDLNLYFFNIVDYNLMLRGFVLDHHLRTTVTLVMIAIALEIFRNVLRLTYQAYTNYKIAVEYLDKTNRTYTTAQVSKLALRQSVRKSMDELIKFITFTTILIFVFILFPRLKLLSMVVASMAAILLDFIIPARMKIEKGDDLITRIIVKVFRL